MVQKQYNIKTETDSVAVQFSVGLPIHSKNQKRIPQYIVSAAVSVGAFAAGTVLGWSSPALPSVVKSGHFPALVPSDLYWIGSLVTIGAIPGALIGGYGVDKIGRKNTVIASMIPLIIGWLSLTFAVRIWMLFIGRIWTGLGFGIMGLSSKVYLTEISHPDIRGRIGAIYQTLIKSGILFAYVLGSVAPYEYLSGTCAAIPVIFIMLSVCLPESPRYLLSKGQPQRAKEALCWLRGANVECPNKEVLDEINEIQQAIDKKNEHTFSWKDLLTVPVIKPILIVLGLVFFNQFCGGNAFAFYAVMIFEQTGTGIDAYLSGIIVGVFQLFATVMSALFVDKSGRRRLLIISFVSMSLSLITLGVFYHLKASDGVSLDAINWIPLLSLIIYNAAYCGGVASLIWTVMSEILPNNIIGSASGFTQAINWILAFIITRFFHDVNEALGAQNAFWMFATFCALGVIFVYRFVPETKRRSLEKIQEENFEIKNISLSPRP